MDEDEWETIFRIYDGDGWDSHDDYLSQERSARYGDEDDSQFRSWKMDQWKYAKIKKVKKSGLVALGNSLIFIFFLNNHNIYELWHCMRFWFRRLM